MDGAVCPTSRSTFSQVSGLCHPQGWEELGAIVTMNTVFSHSGYSLWGIFMGRSPLHCTAVWGGNELPAHSSQVPVAFPFCETFLFTLPWRTHRTCSRSWDRWPHRLKALSPCSGLNVGHLLSLALFFHT